MKPPDGPCSGPGALRLRPGQELVRVGREAMGKVLSA